MMRPQIEEILLGTLALTPVENYDIVCFAGCADYEVSCPMATVTLIPTSCKEIYTVTISTPGKEKNKKWNSTSFAAHYSELESFVHRCSEMLNEQDTQSSPISKIFGQAHLKSLMQRTIDKLQHLPVTYETLPPWFGGSSSKLIFSEPCEHADQHLIATIDAQYLTNNTMLDILAIRIGQVSVPEMTIGAYANYHIPASQWSMYPLLDNLNKQRIEEHAVLPIQHNACLIEQLKALADPTEQQSQLLDILSSMMVETPTVVKKLKSMHPAFEAVYLNTLLDNKSSQRVRRKI